MTFPFPRPDVWIATHQLCLQGSPQGDLVVNVMLHENALWSEREWRDNRVPFWYYSPDGQLYAELQPVHTLEKYTATLTALCN